MEHVADLPYRPPEFMFFSQSKHVRAGTGVDEYIHPNDWNRYEELNNIPNWRKMLSNFFGRDANTPLFELDGRKWRTAEHYFHANKFLSNPEYYEQFALDSGSILSRSDGNEARKAGRSVKMAANEKMTWDAGASRRALDRAQDAKFRQNPDLARVLMLTDGAVLKHRMSFRSPIVIEAGLMILRNALIAEKNN